MAGKKPSKGTPADMRLKRNKAKASSPRPKPPTGYGKK